MSENNYFSSNFKLGVVGGGQLGKMLLAETRKLDIKTKVLDPSEQAPCRIGCNEFIQGNLQDFDTVYQFGKDCDVVTIEIENINTEALQKLSDEGVKVYPQPQVVELIKSKIKQKDFYRNNYIPTAEHLSFDGKAALLAAYQEERLPLPFVWKIDTGGFDGRGVQVVRTEEDLSALPEAACLAEKLVDFKTEIAVVVARSEKGEVQAFPTVEMDFHPTANLVEYVFSPGLLSAEIAEKARELACYIAEKLEIVGVLAVEMFETKTGQLLINEVAPRVHNSGHLSIEGNLSSQFEQHLRAILNLPLAPTDTLRPSVMVNLVGEEGYTGPVHYKNIAEVMAEPGVYIHLYGKAETRPFRKMGHVTITAESLEEARERAKKVKELIKVVSI
jgi:5-(carboxyamino)imidazole ribonucleotide synthase